MTMPGRPPHTTVGGGSGAYYPMPLIDHVTNCRICGAPLAEFHSRYAKFCGVAPCPTSKGCCGEFQLAPRTWRDQAEKLVKALGE